MEELPDETVCEILTKLKAPALVSVLGTSVRLRGLAQGCVRSLDTGDETIPVSLLRTLELVTRVNGYLDVEDEEELAYVSRRVRGSLSVIGGEPEGFNPQDSFLEMLMVRASLYPESAFRGTNEIRGGDLGTEEEELEDVRVPLPIEWLPDTKTLTLHLLLPLSPEVREEMMTDTHYDTEYSRILARIFDITKPQILDLDLQAGELHEYKVMLSDPGLAALGSLDLRVFRMGSGSVALLGEYVIYREAHSLPIALEEIHVLMDPTYPLPSRDFLREYEVPSLPGPPAVTGTQPIPSVTVLTGILTSLADSYSIMELFPNIQSLLMTPSDIFALRHDDNFRQLHPRVALISHRL